MEDSVVVKKYIDDLFEYLDTFERGYERFETEAFLQTYNGICAVFQALCKQRDKAVAVDGHLLEKIKHAPLTSSDLRQLTVQVLVTFFEVEADIDGQSDRAYSYCRGVRAVKQDVPFFENHLIPLLFRDGSLNNNFRLNMFFLMETSRYINSFGKALNTNLSPEAFAAMSESIKFLELGRRRLQLGKDVIGDRTSLEFHLQRIDSFKKLRQKNRLAEQYLREWGYLREGDFWAKVKAFFCELGGKVKGAFSSSRYFRMVWTQRNPAFLLYGIIIVLSIWLAIYVPMKWTEHQDGQFLEFEERVRNPHGGSGN